MISEARGKFDHFNHQDQMVRSEMRKLAESINRSLEQQRDYDIKKQKLME